MALTQSTNSIKNAAGLSITIGTAVDGSSNVWGGTAITGDGLHFMPSMDAVSRGGYQYLTDGSNTVGLFQFHNADNQALGAIYGLNTGGVAQLVNPAGSVDRQRTVNFDSNAAVGIPAGANNYAVPYSTTLNQSISLNASPQVVNITSSANLKAGCYVNINPGQADNEQVYVTAVGTNTMTAVFTKNHSSAEPITWFLFNVARDAAAGDQIALTGIGAALNYFYNTFTGLVEMERSAAGERDNASGTGTNVAAEYEYTTVGFDRAKNLNGKGLQQSSITSTSGSDANLTFSSDPSTAANGGLKAGAYLVLTTGTSLAGGVDVVQVGQNYTSGVTVPVTVLGPTTSVTAGRTYAAFDSYAIMGPGLNGFLPHGIGIEEEAIYDPVSGKYFIERAATQDAVSGQNIVMESAALFNGTTFDRLTDKQIAGAADVVVRGRTSSVTVTPTVTASSYTAGFVVGGLLTFANALDLQFSGRLLSVTVKSKSAQTTTYRLYLFSQNPTNTTWTDHAAPSINAADIPYLLGSWTTGASDSSLGTCTINMISNPGDAVISTTSGLYGILVAVGTPTYTSTSDISVNLRIAKD